MFDKFQDYMYYLLYAPLKKIARDKNQFYIFFKVLGKLFDQSKHDIFRVREESMIISASARMLEEHGRDRNMKRLKGESLENYRIRLLMKNVIAEKAGENEGILLALKAIGYEQSQIEPFYIHDPERWAEFTVFLSSKQQSGVKDLNIIDREVMKIKPASGKPSYGIDSESNTLIKTEAKLYPFEYPICNVLVNGTWYESESIGRSLNFNMPIETAFSVFDNDQYRCNTFNTGYETEVIGRSLNFNMPIETAFSAFDNDRYRCNTFYAGEDQ